MTAIKIQEELCRRLTALAMVLDLSPAQLAELHAVYHKLQMQICEELKIFEEVQKLVKSSRFATTARACRPLPRTEKEYRVAVNAQACASRLKFKTDCDVYRLECEQRKTAREMQNLIWDKILAPEDY